LSRFSPQNPVVKAQGLGSPFLGISREGMGERFCWRIQKKAGRGLFVGCRLGESRDAIYLAQAAQCEKRHQGEHSLAFSVGSSEDFPSAFSIRKEQLRYADPAPGKEAPFRLIDCQTKKIGVGEFSVRDRSTGKSKLHKMTVAPRDTVFHQFRTPPFAPVNPPRPLRHRQGERIGAQNDRISSCPPLAAMLIAWAQLQALLKVARPLSASAAASADASADASASASAPAPAARRRGTST